MSDWGEFFGALVGDRTFRRILRMSLIVLIVVFIMASGFFFYRAYKGYPAKFLFGLIELGDTKADTVYRHIVGKKDTVFEKVFVDAKTQKTYRRNSNPNIKNDSVPRNHTTSSGSNAHIVNGNGNSVGVNGDVINGIKQRHLNNEVAQYLINTLPNKTEPMQMLFAYDKETMTYATEVYNFLIQQGYTNITPSKWLDPDGYDKINVIKEANTPPSIRIYPASNVQ
ncbi:hypothetical protein GCM10023149_30860 [Mucilaginibacter gynuensis]|uniref:Uncharacterized protein n=1 Tax=Mucilaginibacter gynuensis TaxID=1302236 RepID=A0ABP8GNA9_9SPHI